MVYLALNLFKNLAVGVGNILLKDTLKMAYAQSEIFFTRF